MPGKFSVTFMRAPSELAVSSNSSLGRHELCGVMVNWFSIYKQDLLYMVFVDVVSPRVWIVYGIIIR